MVTTYIIAGAPRAGKSIVLEYLLKNYTIPGISTDLLREGFGEGNLDLGIRSDDDNQSDEERSEILWPFLKGLIKARSYYTDKLAIEGTNFLPKYLAEFKDRPYLRVCYLGFPSVDVEAKCASIRAHEQKGNDWTSEMTDEELTQAVMDMKRISQGFEEECLKYGFKFFDTSVDFEKMVVEAAEYLVKE